MKRLRSLERGASAVEFAMLAPLFFMLVLGMFSGGLAYNTKVSLTHASRESVRFGATLPTGKVAIPNTWFEQIADRAVQTASGDLAPTQEGRYTCVAYIGYASPVGSSTDWTQKREQTGSGGAIFTTGSASNPASWCYDDGEGTDGNERRVQVVVKRKTDFNALVFFKKLDIAAQAVAKFEAANVR